MDHLKQSIADKGQIQPIIVRKIRGGYIVFDGNRRVIAMEGLGHEAVKARIIEECCVVRNGRLVITNIQSDVVELPITSIKLRRVIYERKRPVT